MGVGCNKLLSQFGDTMMYQTQLERTTFGRNGVFPVSFSEKQSILFTVEEGGTRVSNCDCRSNIWCEASLLRYGTR